MIESDVYLTDKYKKENFNNTLFTKNSQVLLFICINLFFDFFNFFN